MIKEKLYKESNVILSICKKCNNTVRACLINLMPKKIKNGFNKEVIDYNLYTKEVLLVDYIKEDKNLCKCDYIKSMNKYIK